MGTVRQSVEWHGEIVLEGGAEHPFRIGRGHHGPADHWKPGFHVAMGAKVHWGDCQEGREMHLLRVASRVVGYPQRYGGELS
jgi:hypothetical protein